MAIVVYGFTVVVPLSSIEHGYPGGLLAWMESCSNFIGRRVWFDDKLVGIAYLSPDDSYSGVCEWRKIGFKASLGDASLSTALLCAQTDTKLGVLDMGVDWLVFEDGDIPRVSLKGSEPGRTAGLAKYLAELKDYKKRDAEAVAEWLKQHGGDRDT